MSPEEKAKKDELLAKQKEKFEAAEKEKSSERGKSLPPAKTLKKAKLKVKKETVILPTSAVPQNVTLLLRGTGKGKWHKKDQFFYTTPTAGKKMLENGFAVKAEESEVNKEVLKELKVIYGHAIPEELPSETEEEDEDEQEEA